MGRREGRGNREVVVCVCLGPYLGVGCEVVGEVWDEVHARLRSYGHAHSAEVGPGIGSHQWVPDTSHHLGQPDQSLGVLLVGQETVALHNGRLHIAELESGKTMMG